MPLNGIEQIESKGKYAGINRVESHRSGSYRTSKSHRDMQVLISGREDESRGATKMTDRSRAMRLTLPVRDASARDVATTRGRRHHTVIANLYNASVYLFM